MVILILLRKRRRIQRQIHTDRLSERLFPSLITHQDLRHPDPCVRRFPLPHPDPRDLTPALPDPLPLLDRQIRPHHKINIRLPHSIFSFLPTKSNHSQL